MRKILSITVLCLLVSTLTAGELKPLNVYLVGDMPMAGLEDDTLTAGWGRFLVENFVEQVTVSDFSREQLSTKALLNNDWAGIKNELQKKSVIIISFGNTDMSLDENNHSDIVEFQNNLKQLAKEAKKKGCTPIFVTPVAHRYNSRETNELLNRFGAYTDALRHVAQGNGYTLVDLNALTTEIFKDGSLATEFFAEYEIKVGAPIEELPITRLSVEGAQKVAKIVADNLKEQKVKSVKNYIK